MSAWEDEYLDEEVEAYIEFNEEGCGSFHFGYVRGVMDHYRTKIARRKACGSILLGRRRRRRWNAAGWHWMGSS